MSDEVVLSASEAAAIARALRHSASLDEGSGRQDMLVMADRLDPPPPSLVKQVERYLLSTMDVVFKDRAQGLVDLVWEHIAGTEMATCASISDPFAPGCHTANLLAEIKSAMGATV